MSSASTAFCIPMSGALAPEAAATNETISVRSMLYSTPSVIHFAVKELKSLANNANQEYKRQYLFFLLFQDVNLRETFGQLSELQENMKIANRKILRFFNVRGKKRDKLVFSATLHSTL